MKANRIFYQGTWYNVVSEIPNPPRFVKLSGIKRTLRVSRLNGKREALLKQRVNGTYFGWKVLKKAN